MQGSLQKKHFIIFEQHNSHAHWPTRPASSKLYISGGVHQKKKNSAQITTNAFSYIRTESGASRSMRVGVMLFKYYEVLFLEWPLRFLVYLLRKGAYIDFLYIILKHTQ